MKKDLIDREFWDACSDAEKTFEVVRVALHNKPAERPTYQYLLAFIAAQRASYINLTTKKDALVRREHFLFGVITAMAIPFIVGVIEIIGWF